MNLECQWIDVNLYLFYLIKRSIQTKRQWKTTDLFFNYYPVPSGQVLIIIRFDRSKKQYWERSGDLKKQKGNTQTMDLQGWDLKIRSVHWVPSSQEQSSIFISKILSFNNTNEVKTLQLRPWQMKIHGLCALFKFLFTLKKANGNADWKIKRTPRAYYKF